MTDFLLDNRPCQVYWESRIERFIAETKDGTVGAVGFTTDEAMKNLSEKLKAMQSVGLGS